MIAAGQRLSESSPADFAFATYCYDRQPQIWFREIVDWRYGRPFFFDLMPHHARTKAGWLQLVQRLLFQAGWRTTPVTSVNPPRF